MIRFRTHAWLLLCSLALTMCMVACAPAGEAHEPDEPAAEKKEKKEAEKEKGIYAVPEGDVEELIKFIDKVREFQPNSVVEALEYREKGPKAIQAAAEKILEIEKDKSSDAYELASMLVMVMRVNGIPTAKPAERKALLSDIKARFADRKTLDPNDAQLAIQAAQQFEYYAASKLAADAYGSFAKAFSESDDERITEVVEMFIGAERRMNLVGKTMKIEGTQMDGEKFDAKSLKGKVVLLDFWATWCGPCLEEYPNIKQNYELYHDRGFEVVGVSADQNRFALEQYLEEKKVPWTTLHDDPEEGNPTANYYGVMSYPTMILIGRDGKVVSLQARGEELNQLLADLIGPPEAEKKEPKGE